VLVFREAPFHAGHIRSMLAATENAAVISRPCQHSTRAQRQWATSWTRRWVRCWICSVWKLAWSNDGTGQQKR
jgi:hypothetical protein